MNRAGVSKVKIPKAEKGVSGDKSKLTCDHFCQLYFGFFTTRLMSSVCARTVPAGIPPAPVPPSKRADGPQQPPASLRAAAPRAALCADNADESRSRFKTPRVDNMA